MNRLFDIMNHARFDLNVFRGAMHQERICQDSVQRKA